ncbi:MAG: hypothetical protein HKK66_06125 [Chlorobiaceae bacterium]|nr:hypothetical protein [Chlorobiaceae bacterium]
MQFIHPINDFLFELFPKTKKAGFVNYPDLMPYQFVSMPGELDKGVSGVPGAASTAVCEGV